MPPEIRQKYEQAMRSLRDASTNRTRDPFEQSRVFADQNRTGAPDLLEDIVAGQITVNSMKIVVDGREFQGLEDLPPEIRARYEDAIRQLDANGNGSPVFVEGILGANPQGTQLAAGAVAGFSRGPTTSTALTASAITRQKPIPVSPTVTPDTTNGWMLLLIGLFLFLMCVAGVAGVWYIFLP
jgi:hypothetical protein